MKATTEYIERRFNEFNRQMFGGKLPLVPIQLSHARSFVGMCVCKRRTRLMKTEMYDFAIRISTRFDLDADDLDDIIIHEMIHYYIGVNNLKDTSAHGKLFRSMMKDINETFGRHVSVAHRITPEQRKQIADSRPRWRVVAMVTMADGRTGVKVLPRIGQRITDYYNKVSAMSKVARVQLFITNNPFFSPFPCSSVLKVSFVDEALLNKNLTDAGAIHCDGTTLSVDPPQKR